MNTSQLSSTPKYMQKNNRVWLLVALTLLVPLLFAAAVCFGSTDANLIDAVSALFGGDYNNANYKIIFQIRAPRAIGALVAGSALAVSGAIIQATLNNPMASPNIIGVNAGAGFFAILSMTLFPDIIGSLPLFSFAGALLASLLIYAISAITKGGKITIILIGVAVSSILTAGINAVKALFPDSVYNVSGFLIGGLSSATAPNVFPAAALIFPSLALAIIFSRRLDVLSLGEEVSSGLGLCVNRNRLLFLTLASLLAGAAVSFVGLIGFVGLIVPHLIRRLTGTSHRYLIPASALGGAALLLGCDLISRLLFSPYELPVGILLSLIGGPFFIFIILRERWTRT